MAIKHSKYSKSGRHKSSMSDVIDPSKFETQRDQYGNAINEHPLKGKRGGACNRSACQRVPATWYNRGNLAYYCSDCADELNRANADFTDFVQPLCVRADGQPHITSRHEFSEDGLHKWNMSDGTIQAMSTTDAIRTRRS